MKKRLTPAQTLAKYKPVLDLMDEKKIQAPEACDSIGIKYSAFISWKRRHDAKDGKPDGRTTRWKKKEAEVPVEGKKFRKKRTPQLVTLPVPEEKKKTNMVVMIGESADIFKALQMIQHKD